MDSADRGSLTEISFIEVLKNASRSDLTGMIRLEKGPIIKVVYFQNGTIAFASSNEKSDRLAEVLKRAGKLTPVQVEDAKARLRPNISLGKTLVELGYISGRDLLWGARTQVEGILHELVFWKEGIFQVLEGALPTEIIVLNLSVPGIIFDAISKTQDRQWVLDHIGSPEEVYRLVPDFHEKYVPHKLRMMRADDFVSRVNGKRTLEEIAHLAGMDTFEVCKIAVALQLLSLVEKNAEPVQMTLAHAPVSPAVEAAKESSPAENILPEPFDESFFLSEGEVTAPGPEAISSEHETSNVPLGQILEIPSVEELQVHQPEGVVFQEAEEAAAPPPSITSDREAVSTEPAIVEPATNEPEAPATENKKGSTTLLEEFVRAPQFEEEEEYTEPARRAWLPLALTAGIVVAAVVVSGWFYYQKVSRTSLDAGQTAPPANPHSVREKNPPAALKQPASPTPPTEAPPAQQIAPAPAPGPATVNIPEREDTTAAETTRPAEAVDGLSLIGSGRISEAARQWQAQLSSHRGTFVVQILIACQEKTVTDTLLLLDDKSTFRLLPLQYHGLPCYRVLVGPFATSAEAQSVRNNLPATLLQQPSPPQVMSLGQILK